MRETASARAPVLVIAVLVATGCVVWWPSPSSAAPSPPEQYADDSAAPLEDALRRAKLAWCGGRCFDNYAALIDSFFTDDKVEWLKSSRPGMPAPGQVPSPRADVDTARHDAAARHDKLLQAARQLEGDVGSRSVPRSELMRGGRRRADTTLGDEQGAEEARSGGDAKAPASPSSADRADRRRARQRARRRTGDG